MDYGPAFLIVRLDRIIKPLKRLSTHQDLETLNLDHVLSDMIQLVDRPHLTGRKLVDGVRWLLEVHRLGELYIEHEDYEEFYNCFYACLIHLRENLDALNPYVNGRLGYRYKERRGLQSVILERYRPAPG